MTPEQWRQWLAEPWEDAEEQMVRRLRLCTRTGRPAGGESFVNHLESLVGRILQPGKGGRPRKAKSSRGNAKKTPKHG